MVPSSTDSLLQDAYSSRLSKDSNLMFFVFQHMLQVAVDDSCAFISICAQVPIKMQAPQGVPIASRTSAYLVFGTKYSNTGWLNDISVSMLNSSQTKGQREKKGWSTKVQCNTTTILCHDFWNHYLLLLVNHYLLATYIQCSRPVLSTSCVPSHLVLTTIQWGRYYHYLHFINGESNTAQSNISEVTHLAVAKQDCESRKFYSKPVLLNSRWVKPLQDTKLQDMYPSEKSTSNSMF